MSKGYTLKEVKEKFFPNRHFHEWVLVKSFHDGFRTICSCYECECGAEKRVLEPLSTKDNK